MLPEELFSHVAPSVFVVESLDSSGTVISFGSGVVVTSGHVVTNKHVIKGGKAFRVKHGKRAWRAYVTHLHPRQDLCQLGVDELETPAVSLRDSSSITVGERVYAIGAPKGFDLTISEGLVSGMRPRRGAQVIQTTAPISAGSSGGGLFDDQGLLIGITTSSIVDGQNLNFALPSDLVSTLTEHPFAGDVNSVADDTESQESELEDLARQKMNDGKYGEAVKLWRQALRLRPNEKESWLGIGVAYQSVGLHEDAIEAFRKVIQFDPVYVVAWRWLGICGLLTKDFDTAIDAFKEATRINPGEVEILVELGTAYYGKDLRDEALAAYKEAIKLDPDLHAAWFEIGRFYVRTDQYSNEGILALRQAVRLEPDDPYSWQWLALAYHRHGDVGDAQKEFQALSRLEELDHKLAREFAQNFE